MNDDRLVSHLHLFIPSPNFPEVGRMSEKNNKTQADDEKTRVMNDPKYRKRLIELLTEMESSVSGERSAEYYLTKNSFNLRSALKEAQEDARWEDNQTLNKPTWLSANSLDVKTSIE